MSLLERVQQLLKAKGVSIKQAERDAGLANATIRRWDQQKPSLDSLLKMADYLQVSIDYLVRGDSNIPTPVYTCDGVPLSESEVDLIAMYRLISDTDKQTIFDFTKLKYEQSTGEKISIYSTYSDTNKQQESDPVSGGNSAAGLA